MLKKVLSICLCAFMICSMMFSAGVSAADEVYEITDAVFTDDLTSMDYMYSYPSPADNWHLELLTEFKEEGAGTAITAVGYKCGDANDNWVIPSSDWCNIFYKAGEKDGYDKKFTKAEFVVWINSETYDAGRTPVIKVKDSKNGTVSVVKDVVWTKTANQQKKYDWNCQLAATVTFDKGAEFVGLGFDTDTTTIAKTITARYFYLDKVTLYTGVEATKYYNDGSTLENAWSYKNLSVVDDVIGAADYKNGGKMISPVAAYNDCEVVYKVPEGRNFKSFFTEISMKDLTEDYLASIAYSEDGIAFTDFDFVWNKIGTVSGNNPNYGTNNADWTWKYNATVSVPENAVVKFVKVYKGKEQLSPVTKFLIRKSVLLTEGNVVSENVSDSLSGNEGYLYEISNFIAYDALNMTEAKSIATETDLYNDSDLLAVDKLDEDAYIIYKAADGKVFTDFEVKQLTRDNGANIIDIEISASKDGEVYKEITPTISNNKYINSTTTGTVPTGTWNRLRVATGSFAKADGYKYIKLEQPANAVIDTDGYAKANCFKLSNVALTVKDSLENTTVAPGFVETFVNEDNLCEVQGMYAYEPQTRFRPSKDYVGKEEPVYVVYKIADGKAFGKVKVVFTQHFLNNKAYNDVIALDADKNPIEWDNEDMWTVFSWNDGTNYYNEYILYGDVPSDAKYLKIQVNYTTDDWKCTVEDVKIYGPSFDDSYKCAVYSVDGEGAETDLNGTLANGNLKAKISFTNVDLGDKTVYAVAALKDSGKVVKAELETYTLTEDGGVTLDTPVLTDCETGKNVSLEVYLFDVTGGQLTPIANFAY